MKSRVIVGFVLAVVVIVGAVSAQRLLGDPAAGNVDQAAAGESRESKGEIAAKEMLDRCQALLKRHEDLQTDMKAMDEELEELVDDMENSSDGEKMEAMALVVEKIVEQRKEIHRMVPEMQIDRMRHMIEHMEMATRSMLVCPMARK